MSLRVGQRVVVLAHDHKTVLDRGEVYAFAQGGRAVAVWSDYDKLITEHRRDNVKPEMDE